MTQQSINRTEPQVRHTGDKMSETARDFATDPCSSAKRGGMVSKCKVKRIYLNQTQSKLVTRLDKMR